MYKVYIEDRVVLFTAEEEPQSGFELLEVEEGEPLSTTKLLQKVQNTKRVQIVSPNIDTVFANFRAGQPFIEAGGGVVLNEKKEVLMIFRNARWDLPKGKREAGERIEACAVREVSEECALPLLQIERGALITHTYHCYRIRQEWVLKRTAWYHMRYGGTLRPQPQTIEGITRAEWIPQDELCERASGTYFTIRDVLTRAGYLPATR